MHRTAAKPVASAGPSTIDQVESSPDELHARMPKKQLWIAMRKAVKPPEEVRKHLQAHLRHQIWLDKDGIVTLDFPDRTFRFD